MHTFAQGDLLTFCVARRNQWWLIYYFLTLNSSCTTQNKRLHELNVIYPSTYRGTNPVCFLFRGESPSISTNRSGSDNDESDTGDAGPAHGLSAV